MAWLSIIRPKNLAIVILLQWVVWNFIFIPLSDQTGIALLLHADFIILILTTVAIAAGGYIINDIFDVSSDRINHPERHMVKGHISPKAAAAFYTIWIITGGVMALYLAWKVHRLELLWIYPMAVTLLYWYSAKGKREPWAGNILVAFYCALAILIFVVAEWTMLSDVRHLYPDKWHRTMISTGYLAGFSFLITWIRELVKDMQDCEGDIAGNVRTVATTSGMETSRKYVKILLAVALLIMASCLIIFYPWLSLNAILYHCIFIGGLLLRSLILLNKSTDSAGYAKLSQMLKLIMIAGITGILLIV